MTVTLDLPSQVQHAYLVAAQAKGLTVEELMREALVAAQPAVDASLPNAENVVDPSSLDADEWIQRLKAWGMRNAHLNLPILPDEALRRESMYEDDRGL